MPFDSMTWSRENSVFFRKGSPVRYVSGVINASSISQEVSVCETIQSVPEIISQIQTKRSGVGVKAV